jgi:hypothetical protein
MGVRLNSTAQQSMTVCSTAQHNTAWLHGMARYSSICLAIADDKCTRVQILWEGQCAASNEYAITSCGFANA